MHEYVIFGRVWGQYTFLCSPAIRETMARMGRLPGDGTRAIRLHEPKLNHAHHESGYCIPRVVPYGRTIAARDAVSMIDRAIVAGEDVVTT